MEKKATPSQIPVFKPVSRAVLRRIEPGSQEICPLCNERVKFQAKRRADQVICNVYRRRSWLRVEHYHAECYQAAGEPYGKVDSSGHQLIERRTPVVAAH